MSDILAQTLIFINSIDPYNMLQFGEPDIYIKEAKLLLDEKILTPGKVKDIFYIGYSEYINDIISRDIYNFVYSIKPKDKFLLYK
tara:strand:- start:2747 stop:3001 length:255 start_codon:yes stop_codon:yes gene_type:complete